MVILITATTQNSSSVALLSDASAKWEHNNKMTVWLIAFYLLN